MNIPPEKSGGSTSPKHSDAAITVNSAASAVYNGKDPLIVYEPYIEGKEEFYEIAGRYR